MLVVLQNGSSTRSMSFHTPNPSIQLSLRGTEELIHEQIQWCRTTFGNYSENIDKKNQCRWYPIIGLDKRRALIEFRDQIDYNWFLLR